MKLKIIVHKTEEDGYWAEVPSIPGCVIQGETIDELLSNLHEAVKGCLIVEMEYFTSNREEQNNGDSRMPPVWGKHLRSIKQGLGVGAH